MSPQRRVQAAWAMLGVCLVGWPLTSLTVFSSEPQGILGLSWLALIMTALDIVATADVRENNGD